MKFFNLFKKRKTTSKPNQSKSKEKQNKDKKKENTATKSKDAQETAKKKRSMLKSKRERRREKANRDRNFDMFRGLLGDRDYRTKQGLINALIVIASFACIVLGVVLTMSGFASRQEYMRTNTTPSGEELKFSNSEAKLNFGGAWTDKNRDVTVI